MNSFLPRLLRLTTVLLAYTIVFVARSSAQSLPYLLEPTTPAPSMRLIWQTEPGVRYDLWQSTDLFSWSQVLGYPATAAGLSEEYVFNLGPRGFFRIVPIDEQPPVVTEQYPADSGFAVGKFADLTVRLADPSGIDPASIRLTVGSVGPLAAGAPGLTFSNGTLTYDSGASPLGAWGETVTATLVAADTLGHTLTHTWSFKLEPEPVVASDIFVFGGGPPPPPGIAPAPPTWSIESVAADRIVIAYTGIAPTFTFGQKLCNAAPSKVQEIFYRRVLSISDNPATSRLTLFTTDIPLTDLVQQGSAAITAASIVYETLADGTLIPPPPSLTGTATFPTIGLDLSGTELTAKTPPPAQLDAVKITFDEFFWRMTPRLEAAIEFEGWSMKSFRAVASGTISTASVVDMDVLLVGAKIDVTLFDFPDPPPKVVKIGAIYGVPVYATLGYDFKVKLSFEAKADLTFHAGYRQDAIASVGVGWRVGDSKPDWQTKFQFLPTDIDPFSIDVQGEISSGLSLEPELKFLIYGLAGFSVSIEPEAKVKTVTPLTVPLSWTLEGEVDLTLGLAGPAFEALNLTPELSYPLWQREWPLTGADPNTIVFRTHPQSASVAPGSAVTFTCTADASQAPAFQWYQNGRAIPGQTERSLFLPSVTSGHAGTFFVRARSGSATADSQTATLTVQVPAQVDTDHDGLPDGVETNTGVWVSATNTGTNPYKWDTDGDGLRDGVETHTGIFISATNTGTDPNDPDTDDDGLNDKAEINAGTNPNAPLGMSLIPAGSFQMGNSTNAAEGNPDELPVHTVFGSAFYMDRYEVTKELWDDVRTWGMSNGNGYTDLPVGGGKASTHPVQGISWYAIAKWCNARSKRDGLVEVYYTNDAQTTIYKTGNVNVTNVQVKWGANGYRLPTEAEWEKAARGGASGHRFPWTNVETITHSQANYSSSTNNSYDVSPTLGFHPTYAVNGTPYTSPVGSFAPNGYGLYDMTGNVWEWCWDWYELSYYSGSPVADPQGPPPGSSRVVRGACWINDGDAQNCRVANRDYPLPDRTDGSKFGFRCVRR